jgi:hypothetical protein
MLLGSSTLKRNIKKYKKSITPDYEDKETSYGDETISHFIDGNLILTYEQKYKTADHLTDIVIRLNNQPVEVHDVSIKNTIEDYTPRIEKDIDCNEIEYYHIHKKNKNYILLIVIPMNWVGLMSANYSFYQLIDVEEKVGIQTIAKAW